MKQKTRKTSGEHRTKRQFTPAKEITGVTTKKEMISPLFDWLSEKLKNQLKKYFLVLQN